MDADGRRQYLCHEQWRRERDEEKFDRMLEVAAQLPSLRERAVLCEQARRWNLDRQPLVDERLRTQVHTQVREAISGGAKALVGGRIPEGTGTSVFGGAPGGAAQPRGTSGTGFGYGPELLDEMTTTKVVHMEPAPPRR
ncbi:hypothetical protein [Nocardia nova]|uniref:hypothetical protein n=1 Tax=Nocardia nova TaxID=37330 RepID=UPI003F77780C